MIQSDLPVENIRLLTSEDRESFNQLGQICFANNSSFWSHPTKYHWPTNNRVPFILGYFENNELLSYLKIEIFRNAEELETWVLGFEVGKNIPALKFPVLYLSKSATLPRFQRSGASTLLRRAIYTLAGKFNFSACVSVAIENSQSLSLLKTFQATFYENPVLWNNESYRSDKKSKMAVLPAEVYLKVALPESSQLKALEKVFAKHFFKVRYPPQMNHPASRIELRYNYTKSNHFEFGFNRIPYGLQKTMTDKFYSEYGDCTRATYDFRTECILAAHEIVAQNPGKPIYLCLSGGVDSEILCETFRFARLPFKIIIARYNTNLNDHDYNWALNYCHRHQLLFEFFDIDILTFLDSAEYLQLAKQVQCRYPMLTATMKLMEYVNTVKKGVPILGSAECWIRRQGSEWYLVEPEPIQALYRFLFYNGLIGIPGFYQWSPELMNSFILDSNMQDLIQDRIPGVLASADIKLKIYKNYFQIEPRPKYRGFEKFPELMNKKLQEAYLRFNCEEQDALKEVNSLLRRWSTPVTSMAKKTG